MEPNANLNVPPVVEKNEINTAKDMKEMTTPASAMAQPEKKKNKTGMIAGIVCLALLAVAGLSFGAYAMITKDAAVADVRAKCGNDKTDNELPVPDEETKDEYEVSDVTCPDGTKVEVEVPSIKNPSEYIIVGEFGIKIKKPENWLSVISKYTYYNDWPHAVPTFEVVDREGNLAYISPIGTDCESTTFGYSACFNIGDTYYAVSEMPNPSGMTEADGLTETYRAFYDFVTNPDNYSKI